MQRRGCARFSPAFVSIAKHFQQPKGKHCKNLTLQSYERPLSGRIFTTSRHTTLCNFSTPSFPSGPRVVSYVHVLVFISRNLTLTKGKYRSLWLQLHTRKPTLQSICLFSLFFDLSTILRRERHLSTGEGPEERGAAAPSCLKLARKCGVGLSRPYVPVHHEISIGEVGLDYKSRANLPYYQLCIYLYCSLFTPHSVLPQFLFRRTHVQSSTFFLSSRQAPFELFRAHSFDRKARRLWFVTGMHVPRSPFSVSSGHDRAVS